MTVVPANPHPSRFQAPDEETEVVPSGVRDDPSVGEGGRRRPGLDGVVEAPAVVHADHRGSLMEAVNFDDPFWEEPVVYAYSFTVAPGRIKGWGMHRRQTDRYVALAGRLRVVLYDGRPGSTTFWHADQNVGDAPCRVINFPTRPYDRDAPDKYRIDPASGEIPFDFTLRDG
jgi:dTDP-4-dehydrorhamnose 3,5-epimerase